MKTEQQNITIALSVGLVRKTYLDTLDRQIHGWHDPKTKTLYDEVPDYHNDLNAMHEAENSNLYRCTGGVPYMTEYVEKLKSIVSDERTWEAVVATAAQRAKAYLQTLNLWED